VFVSAVRIAVVVLVGRSRSVKFSARCNEYSLRRKKLFAASFKSDRNITSNFASRRSCLEKVTVELNGRELTLC